MSDNEYERFEVTDYDLDNEFNTTRRRHLSKNQQIYGIWADDSDNDSADEGTSRRGRRGRSGLGGSGRNKPKDYSAPVSFVAGGIQQAGKKKKEAETEQPITDEDESENESDGRPAFGGKQPQLADAGSPGHRSDSDTSSDEERTQQSRAESARAQRDRNARLTGNPNVGAWEQHTRGIGAKLLLQMGYQPGKGLGKDLQGISQPVEARMRKGRGAVGAYGPEVAASVGGKVQSKLKDEEDPHDSKGTKERINKWKKKNDSRRYFYRSVEEVIEKGKKGNFMLSEKISNKLGNVPVIDMTGPEKRVLSGYHALGQTKILDEDLYDVDLAASSSSSATTKKASNTTAFALPELMHNLQLIVNKCESDIIALDKAEREAADRQAALEQERKNIDEIVQLEKNHIDTLVQALALVQELSEPSEALTLQRAEKIFVELQQDFPAEYKEFALGDLAAGVIAPLVKIELENWQPLVQPTLHVDLIKKWRGILETNDDLKNESRNIFDPYSSLVWAGVIPSFRACAATWNPKQHQQMAALLDCWAPLFPTWILDSVLEQLVLPQLSNGVRNWDPLTDTVPIHIWILPWNNILGHKMEEFIFPTIRGKLAAALAAWMPQDRSARAMLTPWKGAFNDTEMQIFLAQHIIPKLQMVLTEFIINPLQQDLEPWNQVWEWHELISPMLMAQLLDKYFFPKWMQVLVLWLNQAPDYAEISRWYTGWKSMFSEEVLREPNIKEHLRRALEIMHRATEMVNSVPINVGMPTPLMTTTPPPPPPPMLDLQQISMPAQLEFKELVSQKCAERGILFAPLPGRREMGKQIYRVGKLFCYIDRNVCMLSDVTMKNWIPTAVQQVLERAVTGVM